MIYFPRRIDLFSPGGFYWMLHELEHVSQYRAVGGRGPFVIKYLLQGGMKLFSKGSFNVHDSIPLEKDAINKSERIFNTTYKAVIKLDSSINSAFGYTKNGRLITLENRTEAQAGHFNWAIGQKTFVVKKEILDDTGKILKGLKSVNKQQLNEIFGYVKNARLLLTKDRIEEHAGHTNWANGQSSGTVKGEIKADIKRIRSRI